MPVVSVSVSVSLYTRRTAGLSVYLARALSLSLSSVCVRSRSSPAADVTKSFLLPELRFDNIALTRYTTAMFNALSIELPTVDQVE